MKRMIYIFTSAAICAATALLLISKSSQTEEILLAKGEFCRMDLPDSNPYSIFGAEAVVLMTEFERTGKFTLEVENADRDSPVRKFQLNTRTGIVKLFDKNGDIISEQQLTHEQQTRFLTQDPLAEKYYSISPYAFVLNNPLRFVDPDGRDVWEYDEVNKRFNRTENTEFDRFIVNGQSITFEYGTVTAVRNPTVPIRNRDGTITPNKLTMFEMKSDDNATQLFEFMANPGTTTNVEWSHAKVGTVSSGRNVVGTSHESDYTAVGGYLRDRNYTLREVNHNHPSGIGSPSDGDLYGAELYHGRNSNTILNIYTHPGNYNRYNQHGLIR